MMLKCY